jgi:hypothetical protein
MYGTCFSLQYRRKHVQLENAFLESKTGTDVPTLNILLELLGNTILMR